MDHEEDYVRPGSGRARRSLSVACLFVGSLVASCGLDPVGPFAGPVLIRVEVSGGFAGADYAFRVDGDAGAVVGERCVQLCQFTRGDFLTILTPTQVASLSRMMVDAGILDLDREDYGTQCCDQFHFTVTYRDGSTEQSVRGSSGVLPPDIDAAIGTLLRLAGGAQAITVVMGTAPEAWPVDGVTFDSISVDGGVLNLGVSYGGGCATHDFEAVAWGAWLESFPVQINVFLSHDSMDDPCDAWLSENLQYDLGPLRAAYGSAYGSGSATVIIRLAEAPIQDPSRVRTVEFTF